MRFRRRKPDLQGSADARLERAEADVREQREKLAAEMPLRNRLRTIRAANHLSEELYAALTVRREGEWGGS